MKFGSDRAHAAWRSARRFFFDALVEVDEFACEDLEGLGAHELVLGVGEQQRDGGGGDGGLIGEERLRGLVPGEEVGFALPAALAWWSPFFVKGMAARQMLLARGRCGLRRTLRAAGDCFALRRCCGCHVAVG